MLHLLTIGAVRGKAGVFRMYVAHNHYRCGGENSGDRGNLLVSDGKQQWMGHAGAYHGEFTFSDTWLYEPTNLSWQNFAKNARVDSTGIKRNSIPKLKVKRGTLLLCDTPRS